MSRCCPYLLATAAFPSLVDFTEDSLRHNLLMRKYPKCECLLSRFLEKNIRKRFVVASQNSVFLAEFPLAWFSLKLMSHLAIDCYQPMNSLVLNISKKVM